MKGFLAGGAMVAIALISLRIGTVGAQEDAAKPEFYTAKVRPILDANCARCHGGINHRGGVNWIRGRGCSKGGTMGP